MRSLLALLLCLALGSAGVALADDKTPPTSDQTQSGAARAPAKAEKVATSNRCQGITKKGLQCKRNAKPGTSYCYQHGR